MPRSVPGMSFGCIVPAVSDPRDKDESNDIEKSLQPKKEPFRQDEFDSVMAALGRMVSSSNFLEQTYRHLIVQLLRCHEEESAIIVSRESRRFANTVELTVRGRRSGQKCSARTQRYREDRQGFATETR
jgi:hypothetical protein